MRIFIQYRILIKSYSSQISVVLPFKQFYLFNLRIITLQYVFCFAKNQRELAMGVHMSSHPEPPSQLLPQPILLGCPRAPALSALLHH